MSEETQVAAPAVEVPSAPADVTPESKPSRESLIKERGWSAEEADKAVSRNMAVKEEAAPVEKKAETVEQKVEEKAAVVPPVAPVVPDRRKGIPDHGLTAEQEEEIRKLLPPGSNANKFFFEMKRERQLKQLERQERMQAEKDRDELRERLKALENGNPRVEVDEAGNEIDPDDKPLTMRQIRELQQKQAEEAEKQKQETETRAQTLARVHQEQEEIVRGYRPDFDDTVKLAGEIATKMDDLIDDPAQQKWAKKLIRDFHNAAQNADKLGEDDLTAAELAYEIGKLHPRYGKTQAEAINDGTQSAKPEISPNKGTGGQKHTPEQMKKLEQNTQRRVSSASIPGSGGRRTVSPEDVTPSDYIAMSPEKRAAFKEKYPEQMARLRG